ncbi:MAG: COX15/CtaA family protein [Myxococcota bacterium]|nr:COX15/CtaA family protein [Myxococcota bacterium]
MTEPRPSRLFTTFAWVTYAYLLAVILFGAWVRITGSGAGCGSHWPTCHGELIPRSPSIETMIEYTHRLTSGLCGFFALGLLGWAIKRFGAISKVTAGAVAVLLFVIAEGAIGAGLVLAELVADDASEARALVISLHLVNTLTLVGASALVAWWSMPEGHDHGTLDLGRTWCVVVLIGLVVTSMSGAVTALGDTLFPVQAQPGVGLVDRIREDLSAAQHFLVRLRLLHPIIACCLALVAGWVALRARDGATGTVKRIANLALWITVIQVVLGFTNIALAAPGWMQLLHLLVAQLLWTCFLLLFVAGSEPSPKACQA